MNRTPTQAARRREVEHWGAHIRRMETCHEYMEIEYNNGSITRQYHRGEKEGTYEQVCGGKSIAELMKIAPTVLKGL